MRKSVLQCVAVCCSVLQCVAVCCSILMCVAVCCSALQRVASRCSALQRVPFITSYGCGRVGGGKFLSICHIWISHFFHACPMIYSMIYPPPSLPSRRLRKKARRSWLNVRWNWWKVSHYLKVLLHWKVQPIAFCVSFLQSQSLINHLVLYYSLATFRWRETNWIEIKERDWMTLQMP